MGRDGAECRQRWRSLCTDMVCNVGLDSVVCRCKCRSMWAKIVRFVGVYEATCWRIRCIVVEEMARRVDGDGAV